MGYHESFVVDKILGGNNMSDRPKKRYKDYKRIVTMKTLDTSIYREGLPYWVKFNGDEKGKNIDYYDRGVVGICIEASGGNLTFVFVSGTFVHEEYNTKVVSISCEYLDNSKIEIIPYWDDIEVTKLIDAVKHNPDKYHGYSYWNEEVEVSLRNWDDITLVADNASEEITEDVETEPDMKDFYIDDWDKIIDPNVSTKYPLFVRDKHSSDYWIINYDVLCKALCRKDAIFDISFKMKDCRTQAHCSCNAKDVQVHVGGSVLTGKRPGKKDACVHDAVIEFRACDWKMMDFAHVKLRRK